MALDGIVLKSIQFELESILLNCKIDKVYQPEKDELVIQLRGQGSNLKLLISASSNNPRIHIFKGSKKNPQTPPMFCMLLRKNIGGGRIVNISQENFERILNIDIQTTNELGDTIIRRLIIEIMGKHSNIILVDQNTNKVIDSIKRITPDMSRMRQILPGKIYQLPPVQNKTSILDIDENSFKHLLSTQNEASLTYKFLYQNILGLSPLIARELCNIAHINENLSLGELSLSDKNSLYISVIRLQNIINNKYFKPSITSDITTQQVLAFSCIELSQFSNSENKVYESISDVLEIYYKKRDLFERLKQKSMNLRKSIQTQLERNYHKRTNQLNDLNAASKREQYKIYGELIMANLHLIEPGANNFECLNYYTNETVEIPLDSKFSASKNAQKCFKKYGKLKTAFKLVQDQLKHTNHTIAYLENILNAIDQCEGVEELSDIIEELSSEGIIKNKVTRKSNKKYKTQSKPYHYVSSDGIDIYVGKNNFQNDFLTLKLADKNDLWLHAKNIPGSHVIVKCDLDSLPDSTLEEAAALAAYYSKARNSSTVPIDYTLRKNVKKPNSSKPGMVIYETNFTIYITPNESIINNLNKI